MSRDALFNRELNDVLNLNVACLKNNRKAALTGFKEALDKFGDSPAQLARWLQKWNGGDSHTSELEPFCQVVIYWLRRRLEREGR